MIAVLIGGRRYESSDPALFTAAYRAGEQAARTGEDTDAYIRALYAQGEHAAIAGYLHGLAAAARQQLTEHPVDCPCHACVADRRALTRHLHRVWRRAAA
ncbi:hypothetical protein V2E29_04790 [Streptomyces diastatochromogenes]|uniref:hypothetical protein n=1 Tax=Streptomyces diastatochromogenes TaxID=42236 RepID=UPI002F26D06E